MKNLWIKIPFFIFILILAVIAWNIWFFSDDYRYTCYNWHKTIKYHVPRSQLSTTESELCRYYQEYDSSFNCNLTYENMELRKCSVGDVTIYDKYNDRERTYDEQFIAYFDSSGNELCGYSPFWTPGSCEDDLKAWNPNFNVSNCKWVTLCSSN